MDRAVAPTGGSRRKVIALLAFLLLGTAVLALPTVRRWASAEVAVDRSRIRIATVERGTLVRDLAVQGSVVAAFSPTLTSPVRGVARVLVRAGEVVSAGQALVSVTSPELASQLAQERSTYASLDADLARQQILGKQQALQAEEDVALLEVELDAARRALDRAERIRDEGLINTVEHERAQDDVTVGTMKLEAARKRARLEHETRAFEIRDRESRSERQRLVVADVERQIANLTLRAPVAGLVSRVDVGDRDTVTQGEALVTVVDLSALEIEVAVPETYADDLVPGTGEDATHAEIQYASDTFPARLKHVSPEVEGSRVRAVLAFDGPVPDGLRQNQRVSTRLILETRPNVLKVARGPFVEAGGGRLAFVVEDGVARQQPIQIGSLSVSEIEILDGLDDGDQIILSDLSRFTDARTILLRN